MAKAKTPKTSSSAKKPRAASAQAPATAESTSMRVAEPQGIRELPSNLHERIRARAYELWEKGGRQHNRAEQDWLKAEREILGQHAARKSA